MSHISTLQTVFNCEQSIQQAAEVLGLTFVRKATFVTYAGQEDNCDFALVHPSGEMYEIGFVKLEDGTYELKYDSYDGGDGMMEVVGEKCGKLVAEYTFARTTKELSRRRVPYQVKEVAGQNGQPVRQIVAMVR